MKVNSKVFTERMDMLGNIQIPNCPQEFRVVAERLMNMACELDYSVGIYHDMTELDKKIAVDYWIKYDGLYDIKINDFKSWYLHATNVSEISRAKRWLVEHNYLILPEHIIRQAQTSAENYRRSIKGSKR